MILRLSVHQLICSNDRMLELIIKNRTALPFLPFPFLENSEDVLLGKTESSCDLGAFNSSQTLTRMPQLLSWHHVESWGQHSLTVSTVARVTSRPLSSASHRLTSVCTQTPGIMRGNPTRDLVWSFRQRPNMWHSAHHHPLICEARGSQHAVPNDLEATTETVFEKISQHKYLHVCFSPLKLIYS